MSLAVAFKASEGIVLAADSRVTLTVGLTLPGNPNNWLVPATYDNATKLLTVSGQKYVAASTYGVGVIGLQEPRTAHSLLPEFEAKLAPNRLSVEDFDINSVMDKRRGQLWRPRENHHGCRD